jgi:hypothetical protein
MSIYYSPELVRALMEDRIREARQSNVVHCCQEPAAREPRTSVAQFLRTAFRRQSPASCEC